MSFEGRRIAVRGVVQGVGFRPWVYRLAREAGVGGRVRNDAAGVTIDAFGPAARVESFLSRLRAAPPAAASIREISWQRIAPEPEPEFSIVSSAEGDARRVSIPPDLATCERCRDEIFDPADRRHRYAFTNCTDCGPRFTITRDIPYDRRHTTMAVFRMCPECQREYDDVGDRRFHAQPNACPRCGPRLELLSAGGVPLTSDPIREAARALREGRIVAVKGIGGFHLACNAASTAAVVRLRRAKRREEKPFAVMVADLAAAERLARLTVEERALLDSVERPIVLVERREDAGLSAEVAPRNPLVGLMLPYSPLHHLLLAEAACPLVMTSGNRSEEPIAYRNAEALERLGGIADLFLVHDREIETRCEDSVARVIAGGAVLLRRARGYVPRPVAVARPFARPVLACGAHLKNACCLGVGDSAYLGPHVGDLESAAASAAFGEAVEKMERFLGVRAEIVAHDLHPEYQSTVYARSRAAAERIGVQHHHAHVVSAMAEHGLEGPVLGLAWDGTGYGPDGRAWGGELLLADARGFRRLATFRPLPLPGGDLAVRQVWRLALALVEDAFAGAPPLTELPLFSALPAVSLRVVRQMIASGFHSPLAHGAGRYFDALGSLVLGRPLARHEGQVALEWNLAADRGAREAYPFELDREASPWQLDLRPLTRAAAADLLARCPAATISARFHNALAAAAAEMIEAAAQLVGRHAVVLSGGCFQNDLLAERILDRLRPRFEVFLQRSVPPGDGGIALGQAVVAAAVAAEGRGDWPCV